LFTHINQAGEKARLEKLQVLASQYRSILQEKFNKQYVCPKCEAVLFWGSPTEAIQKAAEKGELLIVSP
jgi:transcription initiation factor IIE alpha subunit